MGFFLCVILDEWSLLCERRHETARAARYRSHRERLGIALNEAGWDGDWYRRGFYDDGSPLGSQVGDECRIDALAQAWSVISGIAPPERARRAMAAVAEHLIDEEAGLIRLLTPPFVNTPHDPGYIKGYVAGVRENGGQYTHAALWVIRAFAELGDRDRAARLLERICPVYHCRDPRRLQVYGAEPYVIAADIYGEPPHVGRAGWTWYTGSAGWMLRVVSESLLGIDVEQGRWLVLSPRIPDDWTGYRARLRPLGHRTVYVIDVRNPRLCAEQVVEVRVDGSRQSPVGDRARIPLVFDGAEHVVRIVLGARGGSARRHEEAV